MTSFPRERKSEPAEESPRLSSKDRLYRARKLPIATFQKKDGSRAAPGERNFLNAYYSSKDARLRMPIEGSGKAYKRGGAPSESCSRIKQEGGPILKGLPIEDEGGSKRRSLNELDARN